jgi:putative endopeptidase
MRKCDMFPAMAIRAGLLALALAVAAQAPARLAPAFAQTTARLAPVSGLDLANFDRSVRPQDDLYRFVNGHWLRTTAVPPERVSYGAFAALADKTELDLRTIIEATGASVNRKAGSPAQQIADLYTSVMDQARIEALGAAPLAPELARIDAIRSGRDLAAEAGYLTSIAGGGPFEGSMAVDADDSTRIVVRFAQGGTLLPDRDYYLNDGATYAGIRAKYEQYLTLIFTLTGRAQPAERAHDLLMLETELAKAQWTLADSRDLTRTFNPFTLDELAKTMPGWDWWAWARPQGLDHAAAISLTQPSFFRRFAALVPELPIETWKAWLAARYITASAPYVSWAFNGARFEFFGRVLTGQGEPRVLWKRGVGLVSLFLGDAIGRLYVEKHFSTTARARVRTIVNNLVTAYRRAILTSTWLTPAARRTALEKLSKMSIKVGFPDRWHDYRGFEIKPDDLLGNFQRGQRFQSDYRNSKVREPDDRGEWLMTPQTVNAYYNPVHNEIVLPAAILQPPLFNLDADDAVNYGAIGGIVGHEIGHAFDNTGRGFDGSGAVRNWWSAQDEQGFLERARILIDQYERYSPIPGMHVNGSLTLGENAGDLAGLSMAFQAYKISLDGRPSPVIDGFTGEQRVFLGWAQAWRTVVNDEFLRQWLLATPYSPSPYRANGPLGHIEGFYEAFAIKPGDGLFREPSARVRIW